jgi:hypothetical protein
MAAFACPTPLRSAALPLLIHYLDFGGRSATLASLLLLWLLWWLSFAMRNPPMKMPVSLLPALDRPALPVLPAKSRSLARPNC